MEKVHIRILKSKRIPYGSRCEVCQTSATFKQGAPCVEHVHRIDNRSFSSHVTAGLPKELDVEKIAGVSDSVGVFAKISFGEATIFGPLMGLVTDFNGDPGGFSAWLLDSNLKESLQSFRCMSDDSCNWIKFIRTADSAEEENIVAYEENGKIFLLSSKPIEKGHELRLRDSNSYSHLPLVKRLADVSTQETTEAKKKSSMRKKVAGKANISDMSSPTKASGQSGSTETGLRRSARRRRDEPEEELAVTVSALTDRQKRRKGPPAEEIIEESHAEDEEGVPDPTVHHEDSSERDSVQVPSLPEEEKTAGFQKKSSSRTIPRNFRGVKRQNHMQHIEEKLDMIITINPYQFSQWQASYVLWKAAFERLVQAGLLENQSEGPHRLKSLINRQVDTYKTKMEKSVGQDQPQFFGPTTRKDHLLQQILQLSTRAEDWDFRCPDCAMQFPTRDLLLWHQYKHAADEGGELLTPVCTTCGEEYETLMQLAGHVEKHGRSPAGGDWKSDFPCQQCKQRFGKEKYLARHMHRMHPTGEQKFDCPECTRKFDSLAAMRKHNTRCHGTKKIVECPVCSQTLPNFAALQDHTELHRAADGHFPCDLCPGKNYKDFKLLRKHIRTNHGTAIFPCPVCQKLFKRLTALQVHAVVHSAHFNYQCDTCGRKFKRREKLQDHVKRLHDPDRVYKFKDRSENIARSYATAVVCQFCTKQYAGKQRLLQHQRKKHPEQLSPPETIDTDAEDTGEPEDLDANEPELVDEPEPEDADADTDEPQDLAGADNSLKEKLSDTE